MRLSKEEINVLKNELSLLSRRAKLYLFGSRADDTKKGGDIDILIVCDALNKKDLRSLRISFFEKFGEQKLDILLDNGEFKNPFTRLVFQKAILL